MNGINKSRIKKELEMFSDSPPSGISCVPSNDQLDLLSAQIMGALGSPYEDGIFQLEIQIPDRYPFDPPRIRFVTPIYHPNIDTSGRICLDTLKLPPKGTWRPCLNISTVLMMIRVLMSEPGSEDPLMTDIWQEFRYDYTTYVEKAKQWTRKHAMSKCIGKENIEMAGTWQAQLSKKKSDSQKPLVMHLPHDNKTASQESSLTSAVRLEKRTSEGVADISNKKSKLI